MRFILLGLLTLLAGCSKPLPTAPVASSFTRSSPPPKVVDVTMSGQYFFETFEKKPSVFEEKLKGKRVVLRAKVAAAENGIL